MQTRNLPPNPKQAYGDKKPRLSLNPLSAAIAQSEAQMDGALKYGEVNWRDQPVEAMTYVDAAIRHIMLYLNGEKYTRDTKVQNLGAVMACCAILIDAELHGTLIDNRKHSPETCDELHKAEAMVQVLKDAQAAREPKYDSALNFVVASMDKYGKHEPVEKAALVCKPTDFSAHPGKYFKPVAPVMKPWDHMPEDAFEVPPLPDRNADEFRQALGISAAKADGKYKGRKPSFTRTQMEAIRAAHSRGMGASFMSRATGLTRQTCMRVRQDFTAADRMLTAWGM